MSVETTQTGPATEMATLLALVERGETVVITDGRGHPAAAVVPFEVLAELSRLRDAEEDRQDAAAIDAAEAEMERTGEQPVPWSVMEAELDALRDAEDAA